MKRLGLIFFLLLAPHMLGGRLQYQGIMLKPVVTVSSLLTGLQVYYKLEDLTDSGPNGLTLTNNGSTTFVTGKVGNAAHMTIAGTQYLNRTDNAVFRMGTSTNFTLAYWIKTTSTGGIGGGVGFGIQGGSVPGYAVIIPAANLFRARISDGTNSVECDSASGVCDGNWHSVIQTVDRAGNMILYVDNPTSETSHVSTASVTGSLDPGGAYSFRINVFWTNIADQDVDEVGLWNRIWTSGERAAWWNGGAGTTYPF